MKRAILTLMCLAMASSPIAAKEQSVETLVSPREIDMPRTPTPNASRGGANPSRIIAGRFGGELVATSEISASPGKVMGIAKIDATALRRVGLPATTANAGATAQLPLSPITLVLELGEESIELEVTHVTYDANRDMHHATAVLIDGQGYARFSFNKAGDVAGTVRMSDRTYAIVPMKSGSAVVAYDKSAGRLPQAWRPNVKGESKAQRALARRHAQIDLVGELQPKTYMQSLSDLSVYIEAAELGHLGTGTVTAAALLQTLQDLGPLTNAQPDTMIRITGQSIRNDGITSIRFVQEIDGIEVNQRNEILVDQTGAIRTIYTSLVSENFSILRQSYSQKEALAAALRGVSVRKAGASEVELLRPAVLRYEFGGGGILQPIFRFALRASDANAYDVVVNANTGEVVVEDGSVRAIEVWNTTSGSPDIGGASGTQLVINSSQTCVGGTSTCSLMVQSRVAYNWQYYFGNAAGDPAACCYNMDVDILNNTPAAPPGGEYRSSTNSILFPATGTGAGGRNADAVLHELGHAYIDQMNPAGTAGIDVISMGIREGIADAIAAVYPDTENELLGWYDFDYGNAWVILDGASFPYPVADRRDLRTPRQWSQMTTVGDDHHKAGEVVGNFFYRVKLGLYNSYPVDMAKFVQRVAYQLRDFEGDGQIDLQDLKRAAYIALDNTSWGVTFINSTFEAMSTQQAPGQEPPAPSGAPSSPTGIISVPTGCLSGYSTYSAHWDAPANTTYYRTFVRLPNSVIYSLSDRIDAPQNWAFGYTNYDTDARVSACNASGCSWMSATAAAMPHNQCF